jgi:hypothetical protein
MKKMKSSAVFIVAGLILVLVFVAGFVAGNHRAALQALNELQMISNSAYEASDNAMAKRVFATHYCGVLDRRIEALRNPLTLFREHCGSYEPESRSRAEIIRELQQARSDWERRKTNPDPQSKQ